MDCIPAFFVTTDDGTLLTSEGRFEGRTPVMTGDLMPFSEAIESVPRGEKRRKIVVCDVSSLRRRELVPDVLKRMRARGSDIWFLTWIEDANDLFDAFNTTAETVIGPYHASASDADLKDMLSVSDSYMPAVFVEKGDAISRGGSRERLDRVVDGLFRIGFPEIVMVDTDDSLSADDWERMSERVIPFVSKEPESHTAEKVITPFRKL